MRAATFVLLLCACRPAPPRLGAVPAFELVDQLGKRFGSDDLRGHPWEANFIFTRCPTICPAFTARMATLQRQSRDLSELRLVSFSVDPEYDTPERLAAYAQRYGADPGRWKFLTGPISAIRSIVVEGLKTSMGHDGAAGDAATIFHGSHFVLVDGGARIRGYYASDSADSSERLLTDARALLAEQVEHVEPAGQPGSRAAGLDKVTHE